MGPVSSGVNNVNTEQFDIKTGVKQGCILSPLLFITTIDYLLKKEQENNHGIKMSEEQYLFDQDFADDIALMDTTEERLQEATNNIRHLASKVGLIFNAKKCEVMNINKPGNLTIKIDDTVVKETDSFQYLGSTICANGDSHKEIMTRIGKAGAAFGNIQKILQKGMLGLKNKLKIYQSLVLSILLYGCETWQIYAADQKKLDAFHTRCLRKILGITFKDRITNEEIFRRTNQKTISEIISERRLRWLGHVWRMDPDRTAKKILNWIPPGGQRSRGRPRLSWKSNVEKDLEATGTSWWQAEEEAQNRAGWRRRTARCATMRHGRTK